MKKTEFLKNRLLEIGKSLELSGNALALLALGSCGNNKDMMDEYSDLDFFVITKPGYKKYYMDHLDWLLCISSAGFYFRNTEDGYKYFYEDGVFCEFAVFEEHELQNIDIPSGSLVWKDDSFQEDKILYNFFVPKKIEAELDWRLGELLTNLYVGLCRFRRGEKYSAYKFVQSYAVDQLIQILRFQNPHTYKLTDPFDSARRVEAAELINNEYLLTFLQGYDKTPQSALSILRFVEENYIINEFMKLKIEELI